MTLVDIFDAPGEYDVDLEDVREYALGFYGQPGEDGEAVGFGSPASGGDGGLLEVTGLQEDLPGAGTVVTLHVPDGRTSTYDSAGDGGDGGEGGDGPDGADGGDGGGVTGADVGGTFFAIAAGGGGGAGRTNASPPGGGGGGGAIGGEGGEGLDGGADGGDADGDGPGGDGGTPEQGTSGAGTSGGISVAGFAVDILTQSTHSSDGYIVLWRAPAPPENLDLTGVGGGVEVGWDGVADADEYGVYRSRDQTTIQNIDPGEDDPIATVDGETTSYFDAEAEPGTEYFYGVTATFEDFETETGVDDVALESFVGDEQSITPPAEAPSDVGHRLVAADEREIFWSINETGADDVDVLLSTDGGDTFTVEETVDESQEQATIDGLSEGQRYWVAIRQNFPAESTQSEWTAALEGLSGGQTPTEVNLSWDNNLIEPSELAVYRGRERFSVPEPLDELEPISPAAEDFDDETAVPDTTYRYEIRAEGSGTATSETLTVTTGELEAGERTIPAEGWYLEIHDGNDTHRPPLVDATYAGTVLDKPELEAVVPFSEDRRRRFETMLDGASGPVALAWKDGVQLPIDTFEEVDVRESDGTLELLCTGGRQLDAGLSKHFVSEENHVAAGEIVDERTDYVTEIDEPDADTEPDVGFVNVSGADLADFWDDATDATERWDISQLQGLRRLQNGYLRVRDFDTNGAEVIDETEAWSENRAVRLDSVGDYVEWEFQGHEYLIEEGDSALGVLFAVIEENPEFELTIGGETVETVPEGVLQPSNDRSDLRWFTSGNGPEVGEGTTTCRLEITDTVPSGAQLYVDAGFAYDNTFDTDEYQFEDTPDQNDQLPGPVEFPAELEIGSESIASVEQVVAAELDVGATVSKLKLSNGEDTLTATDTSVVSGEFADPGQTLSATITLGGTGQRTSDSPSQGFESESIDETVLTADLDSTPVIVDSVFTETVGDALEEIAEDGGFVWELARDPSGARDDPDALVFRMAQSGQRTQETALPAVDVEGRKTTEGAYERVVVEGRTRDAEDSVELFETGLLVGLEGSRIIVGSETVTKEGESAPLTRGVDYQMDYAGAAIKALDGGELDPPETVDVVYQTKVRGQYPAPDRVDDDAVTLTARLPGAQREEQADAAALALYRDVQDPFEEVQLAVSDIDPRTSLIAALDDDRLPFDGPLTVFDSEVENGRVELDIGSRQQTDAAIERLGNRLDALADQL